MPDPLPRSTPAAEGVSSARVLDFLDAARDGGFELHSFMVARHGRVVAEGWWTPFRPEVPHQLHSLTKIFLSTAAGIAIREGRFTLDDPVIGFFPGRVPTHPAPNLAAMRVRHLLTGTTGQPVDAISPGTSDPDAYLRWFLSKPVPVEPGLRFVYNPPASMMLSAIIEKTTGETLPDYLRPRLFKPLGISDPPWARAWPRYPFGAHTEDLLKLGLLHLALGMWRGERILSAKWVNDATAMHIRTADATVPNEPDWKLGYGFQFWRCRHNAYRVDGAFGQYSLVLPDQDAVIAVTSETTTSGFLDLVWTHLLPGMDDRATAGPRDEELADRLSSLALPLPSGSATSEAAGAITAREILLDTNELGAKSISLEFVDRSCVFGMIHEDGGSEIRCGLGSWIEGVTDMPGTPPKLDYVGEVRPVKVAASAAWADPNTLEMHWRFTETPHRYTVMCRLEGGQVTVEFISSLTGQARPVLTGRLNDRG